MHNLNTTVARKKQSQNALSLNLISANHLALRFEIKSNLLLYSLYYVEAYNKLAGPISASLRPGIAALFEENVAAVASR